MAKKNSQASSKQETDKFKTTWSISTIHPVLNGKKNAVGKNEAAKNINAKLRISSKNSNAFENLKIECKF